MIAVDTNILIYAHRTESPWHEAARNCLRGLAGSGRAWAIPWPCVHEFLAVTTHPRIFDPPTPLETAIGAIEDLLSSGNLRLLTEEDSYWSVLKELLESGHVDGPRVHDARVAAICLNHGVSELWTADRDFGRIPALRTRNPAQATREGGRQES